MASMIRSGLVLTNADPSCDADFSFSIFALVFPYVKPGKGIWANLQVRNAPRFTLEESRYQTTTNMNQVTPVALAHWQNFYVIVGSSAGALTGLQFVVLALITQVRAGGTMRDIHAFGTPTVIHFCTALLISALMTAPWQAPASLSFCLGACGVVGVGYSFRIIWHARKAAYRADFEDWVWYTAFPLLAHMALVGGAVLIWWNLQWSLAVTAADALVFLFLGVHNSWDTVTFIAVQHGLSSSAGETQDRVDPAAGV